MKLMAGLMRDQIGQTTAEYVAITSVAVALAIGVLWLLFGGELAAAVEAIGDSLQAFIADAI